MQYWLSQGVDSQKLTLGFPAYSPVPRILRNEINSDKEDTELQEDAAEYTETDTTVRVMAYHEVKSIPGAIGTLLRFKCQ